MAEFQMVAKELERMCNTYHTICGKCNTDECPLYYEDLCYAQAMTHVHSDDACNLEKVVMSWAAKHPEPVYPTWLEFMKVYETGEPKSDSDFVYWMGTTSIPADIAQKLGIEPKEE